MPVLIRRIAFLLVFIAILTACRKKKNDPPADRVKQDPVVLLDTVIQSAFNSFQVSGTIVQPWWLLNPERGILYSADPNPSLDNGTRIPLSSTDELLKLRHDLRELPGGKSFYIRLYVKADTNRVWYSRSIMVSTKTFTLSKMAHNKAGQGMKTEIRIWPDMSELPPDKLEIYLGTYKAEVDYRDVSAGWVKFTVPDNIPPGKYPIIGKLFNLTVPAEDSIQILAGKWSILPNPPFSGRGRMAHFVWKNKGFIVGGTAAATQAAIYREVWQLDIVTRTWTRKKDFPIDLHDAIAFHANNRIFVMGGVTSSSQPNILKVLQPDIWEYDPNNDTWTNKGPHPQQKTARSLMAGTVLNNRIYVGTGSSHLENFYHTNQVFSDWMVFDPATGTWTNLAPVIPFGLRNGACFHDGQNIYMVGGDNANSITDRNVKRYNVATNTWELLPGMPDDGLRTQSAVAYIHNVPYIFGGVEPVSGNWRHMADLWRFDAATRQWTEYLYYNSDQRIIVSPGTPGPISVTFPGTQPAVFPTANGFVLYGGSYRSDGSGNSNALVEYTLE